MRDIISPVGNLLHHPDQQRVDGLQPTGCAHRTDGRVRSSAERAAHNRQVRTRLVNRLDPSISPAIVIARPILAAILSDFSVWERKTTAKQSADLLKKKRASNFPKPNDGCRAIVRLRPGYRGHGRGATSLSLVRGQGPKVGSGRSAGRTDDRQPRRWRPGWPTPAEPFDTGGRCTWYGRGSRRTGASVFSHQTISPDGGGPVECEGGVSRREG